MASLVTVTAATSDIETLFQQLVNYINSFGSLGVTMELRTNTEGIGTINNPVNGFTNVGRVPNFVYTAPTALAYAGPV